MPIDGKVGNKPATAAPTPTYCTVSDLALLMQVAPPSEAGDEGEPTETQWKTAIRWAEARVDSYTGRSWRSRVVRLEYHPFAGWIDEEAFWRVKLHNAPVKPLASGSGDVFEVWNGSTYEDWLGGKTQGRQADWYLQEEHGFLFLRRLLIPRSLDNRIRVSYRYGFEDVPEDVSMATAMLAASLIIAPGDAVVPFGRGGEIDRLGLDPKISLWRREAYATLSRYQAVGGGL